MISTLESRRTRTTPASPRLLLIGPLPRADAPVGGTQVSFQSLVERCRASGAFEVEVLDTSRRDSYRRPAERALGDALALSRTLARLAAHLRRADVAMLNASTGAMLRAGPLVALLCRAYGIPLAVRVFGGDFDVELDRAGLLRGGLVERTLLAAPLVLLQTRSLCARFEPVARVRWLPTTRDLPLAARRPRADCRRFLFLSQLRREKGFAEAIAAIESAPQGCSLTVAGPPMPGATVATLASSRRVRYVGEVGQARVPSLFSEHDALVFPSYYAGEGMPGVVVEALQAGLPVIATRWRSLPEIVEHERHGFIVEPRSVEELALAMRRLALDGDEYRSLCAAARARGDEFRAAPQHARLERWLLELCGRAPAGEARAPLPGADAAERREEILT